MSVIVKNVIEVMEELAPKYLAEDWDNPGLMVGNTETNVSKILFALDCSDEVIDEAIAKGADMIITHHPMIFGSIKSVVKNTPIGSKIYKLINNNISVYSAHTNFDVAEGGTNTVLANLINLKDTEPLMEYDNGFGLGKCGNIEATTFSDFINKFKKLINAPYVTVNGDLNRTIKRVGLCTGSAASSKYINTAKSKGCDLYITGDVGYHDAQYAQEIDICIIDGTHYLTESIAMPILCNYIGEKIKEVSCICSEVKGQTLNIV